MLHHDKMFINRFTIIGNQANWKVVIILVCNNPDKGWTDDCDHFLNRSCQNETLIIDVPSLHDLFSEVPGS